MGFQIKLSGEEALLHQNSASAQDMDIRFLKDEWMLLRHPLGEIKMKQWMFDGVRLAYSDWQTARPVSFEWQGDMEVVTMHYCIKGRLSIGDANGKQISLGHNQQNTYFGTEASGTLHVNELGMKSFMVQFNKAAFLGIADGGTDALKHFADQVAGGKTAVFSPQNLPIDVATQQAIDAILNCRFSDALKRVFFLSKAMELLVLQADAEALSFSPKTSHLKTDYDRERVLFARDYMLQQIDAPPSIPELARIAGINEFKLKKGYKEMFGSTIFGHLAHERLELSKTQLLEGAKSISEIALELGYSSVQHFSNAFKKKFGISPGSYRR